MSPMRMVKLSDDVSGSKVEPPLNSRFDLPDRLAHRLDQLQRLGRRLEAGRGAGEQRVVELLAQLGQRMAHRRLAEADRRGGAADMALGDQRLEGQQQAEVHRAELARDASLEEPVGHSSHE